MLEALDDSQRAQRQLVADASHELRTPLTSLRTNIEVLAQVDALPPEDRERLLRGRRRAARRADRAGHRPGRPRPRRRAWHAWPRTCGSTCSWRGRRARRRHAPDRRFETRPRALPGPRSARRASTARSATCSTTPRSGARPAARSTWTSHGGELRVRDHGPGHRRRRPAARVRPLLPLARRARACRARASGWRSCARSSSRTAAGVTRSARGGGARLRAHRLPVWTGRV